MSNLVTGEAVELDLRHARLATRGVAFGIDVLLQAVALGVLYAIAFAGSTLDGALLFATVLVVSVVVLVGYPVTFETLSRGRTIGKLALGLKVVREDGGPIRFRHALVRGLAGFFVDFWALGLGGFVAVVVSLSSTKGKRVGDFLAGTVVINVRAPREHDLTITMPPPLAGWAAGLDLTGLPDDLALTIRQFLGRYEQLSPAARDQLGAKLTAELAERIGASPPPDAPTWAFLSAVLAERRAREESQTAARTTPPPTRSGDPDGHAPPAPPLDNPFAPPG